MNLPINISLSFVLLLMLGLNQRAGAQNLVTNGSFENMTDCPDNWAQLDRVSNWMAYKGTPDYFNSCELTNSFSTPQNLMGSQNPASGNAYVGLIFYSRNGIDADEIMGTQLSQQLTIGTKYYISFKLVLKYNNPFGVCCANNKIGAKFSTQPYISSNPPAINNIAHVWTDSIVNDTLNWTTVFGSFTADSAYNYLMIGNFYTNPNISINDIAPANDFGYYFVDDACVSTDSLLCANFPTSVEENSIQNQFSFYPNPATDLVTIQNRSNIPFDVEIYNSIGQLLLTEQNVTSDNLQLDISPYSRGLLFIKTISLNNQHIHKLVKQ